MNKYIILLLLISLPLFLSLDWPGSSSVVTEFASPESTLQRGVPSPYIALSASDGFMFSADGTRIFSGQLSNGLGNIEVVAVDNGYLHVYGNTEAAELSGDVSDSEIVSGRPISTEKLTPWTENRKPLIFMILDRLRHRVVNPEVFFESPQENDVPTLRRLRFYAAGDENPSPIDIWSWYRNVDISNGSYIVSVDWADGRNEWNDVENIFSIRLYLNGQLIYRNGIDYMFERENILLVYPGISSDDSRFPMNIQPGQNIVEVYIQDPKGLSSTYEFIINGGLLSPQ